MGTKKLGIKVGAIIGHGGDFLLCSTVLLRHVLLSCGLLPWLAAHIVDAVILFWVWWLILLLLTLCFYQFLDFTGGRDALSLQLVLSLVESVADEVLA